MKKIGILNIVGVILYAVMGGFSIYYKFIGDDLTAIYFLIFAIFMYYNRLN